MERATDREMVAATEVAKRNPMRPPDTLPRDAATAIRVFAAHPSPQLIALFVAVFAAWRLWLGHFTWKDAAVALVLVAYFPFNEWLIHVFMLHF